MVGLLITIEPDVVPKGTVDLKKLDAAPGTKPPLRRIEADGSVHLIEEPAPKPAPAPVPAPVAAAPVAAVVAAPALEDEPLGMKLRKKTVHADSAMPPRPASAETTASGRLSRDQLPADDYETNVISGGFGSALWSLVKVTAVLAIFTLATVFTYLKWNDLLPWSSPATPSVAVMPPVPRLPEKKPAANGDTAAPASGTAPAAKPEPAHVATESSAAIAVGLPDEKKLEEKKPLDVKLPDEKKPEEPKVAEKPKVSGSGVGEENEFDVRKAEQLRADAVRLGHAGKLDEALAKLDELLALNPKDGDALFRRALIFHQKRDIKGAVKAYEEACACAGAHDARAFNNLGLCHEALGDIKSAKDAYERGLAHDPEDPNVLTNLGRLEEDQDYKKAFARYEKALERDAKHAHARYHRAALLALRMDRVADGKKELEQLVGQDSPVRAEALDELGKIALRERRFADAEQLLRDALDAGSQDARLFLGTALLEEGKAQPAVEEIKAFLDKNPKNADAWKTLGAALVKLEMLQDAKKAYEVALAINDKDPDTHFNYGLCAERFGNFLAAVPEYERVLQLEPNHWKALTNLGRLYQNAGRDEKALGYFDRAIQARPTEAGLYLHRANALVALKKDDAARAALQDFVKLAPPSDPRVAQAQRAIQSTGPLKPAGQSAASSSSPTTNATGDKPKF